MTAKSKGKAATPAAKQAAPKNSKPKSSPKPSSKPGAKPVRSSTKAVSKRPAGTKAAASKPAKESAASAKSSAEKAKLATFSSNRAPEPEPREIPKKELVQRMMDETGMKAGDARRALDATLKVLADGLREGANISAAPLGKIRITRSKETANGDLVVCRIKLKKLTPGDGGKSALETYED